jgi:hypothetical protein
MKIELSIEIKIETLETHRFYNGGYDVSSVAGKVAA